MPKSEPPSFHVRLSPALLKRIKLAAIENGHSINTEISVRLENSFELADSSRQELRTLLTDALSIIDKGGKA